MQVELDKIHFCFAEVIFVFEEVVQILEAQYCYEVI